MREVVMFMHLEDDYQFWPSNHVTSEVVTNTGQYVYFVDFSKL
jgi:hypothetical protein